MHAQSQMLENCKIPISFNLFGNIQSVRCGHYAIWMYPFNITLFIFEYPHKMLPDPPLVTSPPLCGVNPVRSLNSLPPSLYSLVIADKKSDFLYINDQFLPWLVNDFNHLFQFNWNIFWKHMLVGHKINFKIINSKINWPQFFCNNSFSTCFDFFEAKSLQ